MSKVGDLASSVKSKPLVVRILVWALLGVAAFFLVIASVRFLRGRADRQGVVDARADAVSARTARRDARAENRDERQDARQERREDRQGKRQAKDRLRACRRACGGGLRARRRCKRACREEYLAALQAIGEPDDGDGSSED